MSEPVLIKYSEMFKAIQKLVGRKIRTKLEVNINGDIYNRKKVGHISSVQIREDGTYCAVLFNWKTDIIITQQNLWIRFENLEFEVEEIEDSLGYLI